MRLEGLMAEQDDGNRCKVTLKGVGIAVEKEVDLQTAAAVMHVLFGGAVPPPASTASGLQMPVRSEPLTAPVRGQLLSIREFLEECGSSSIHSKILGVGRYMRDHEDQADFSRE